MGGGEQKHTMSPQLRGSCEVPRLSIVKIHLSQKYILLFKLTADRCLIIHDRSASSSKTQELGGKTMGARRNADPPDAYFEGRWPTSQETHSYMCLYVCVYGRVRM